MIALAPILEPIAAIAAGGGPTHTSPASSTASAKRGGLGEEAVPGVDRIGAGASSGVDEQLGAQVGVGGRRPGQPHPEVARAHVERIGVGVAEHGHGRHAEAPAGAGDAAGDLAAVGDQQGADGRDGRAHGYIRNTP